MLVEQVDIFVYIGRLSRWRHVRRDGAAKEFRQLSDGRNAGG